MAQIIVDNVALLEEGLLTPNRKPVGNVEIDWNHPLARGLIACWIFTDRGFRDLTGKYNGTTVGTINLKPEIQGVAASVQNTNTTDRITIGSVTQEDKLSGRITRHITAYIFANQGDATAHGNSYPRFMDKNAAAGYTFYLNFGTNEMAIAMNGKYPLSNSIAAHNNKDTGYGYYLSDVTAADKASFYLNGKFLNDSTTSSGEYFSTASVNASLLNSYNSSDRQFRTPVYCQYFWDRPLTDMEHASIHADRYQFLKPVGMVSELSFLGTPEEAQAEYYRMMSWF